MTASARPDMTLEQIITQRQDSLDRAATVADTFTVFAEAMTAAPVGSRAWAVAVRAAHKRVEQQNEAHWEATLWSRQIDQARRLLQWAARPGTK